MVFSGYLHPPDYFIWYLHPADYQPARIKLVEKSFAKELDFKYIRLSVKIRDIHKIETKNSIAISFFGYENKNTHPIYVSKECC